ncbi:MAG: hypothetical protein ACXVII_41230 [Solirubrobacteraceae bacterium]
MADPAACLPASLSGPIPTTLRAAAAIGRDRRAGSPQAIAFLDAPPPTAANGRGERRHEEPTSASPPHREPTLAAA